MKKNKYYKTLKEKLSHFFENNLLSLKKFAQLFCRISNVSYLHAKLLFRNLSEEKRHIRCNPADTGLDLENE